MGLVNVGDACDRTSLAAEETTEEARELLLLLGCSSIRAAELALEPEAPLAEEGGALLFTAGEAERFALPLAIGRGLTRMDLSTPTD